MAGGLMRPPRALLLTLLSGAFGAQAQGLPDPTRPPASIESPQTTTATTGSPAGAPATGLQSIIRRDRGKPAALINGEYVELGGKVGENRVVRIGDDSVTLQGPAGKEVLRLTPGVEKKFAAEKKSPTAPDRRVRRKAPATENGAQLR
jgi:MSHA biogenesis protein MshK